jgi:hypothetical protein
VAQVTAVAQVGTDPPNGVLVLAVSSTTQYTRSCQVINHMM